MILPGNKLRSIEGGGLMFRCPGCGEAHQIRIRGAEVGDGPSWLYNSNSHQPTFTPSILVRGVRASLTDEEYDRLFDEYTLPQDREKMLADTRINIVCHSFVTDGRIQFLGDCTHALAGQTVDLPDWSEDE